MSNNLDLDQVVASQTQKEVTINEQAGQLDAAMTEQLAIDLVTDGATTLTDSQFRRNVGFVLTHDDVLDTLTLPATLIPKHFFVNNTAGTDTVNIIKGSTTIPIVAGGTGQFIADSTTNGLVLLSENGALPYDMGTFFTGVPGNSEIILRFVFTRAVDFADNFAGSQFTATTAATASTVFDIDKGGVKVGDITIAISGTTGTFDTTTPGITSFAAGDRLEIHGPASADATLADFDLTLFGTRGV